MEGVGETRGSAEVEDLLTSELGWRCAGALELRACRGWSRRLKRLPRGSGCLRSRMQADGSAAMASHGTAAHARLRHEAQSLDCSQLINAVRSVR